MISLVGYYYYYQLCAVFLSYVSGESLGDLSALTTNEYFAIHQVKFEIIINFHILKPLETSDL